ncbi:hypothetical protein [uncultured Campylobacter sp.]|uniref:hypothetical protein n=1 Tax=uncultured Campylobacter sp. TaxID=218934 RepID=UPI0026068EBD|nr:hypothetical protein [uncultured Campylobacter sp.]
MLCGVNFKMLPQSGAKPSAAGPCVAQNSIATHRTYRIGLRAGKILTAPSSHARVQIPQAKYRAPSRMSAAATRCNLGGLLTRRYAIQSAQIRLT